MDDDAQAVRYPLEFDLVSGTFRTEEDRRRYVRQLIRQVVMTAPGERVMRPEFGCGVRQMLFMPNSPVAANLARITIYQALQEHLGGHIDVEKVEIHADRELLEVDVHYRVKSTGSNEALQMEMTL